MHFAEQYYQQLKSATQQKPNSSIQVRLIKTSIRFSPNLSFFRKYISQYCKSWKKVTDTFAQILMMRIITAFLFCSLFMTSISALSQSTDTAKILPEVKVVGYKSMNGIGRITDYSGPVIFAGKKNEILVIDSLDANKAINNTRQIIGRIPGLNIIETESSGFTANGIAFRGLNPYQSKEMNTRQNGYNISADIYGYNEAYYLPPMEATQAIQIIRGAAGLQFGAQPGGMINYILKDAPKEPFAVTVSQTAGSNGLYNAYTSAGGTSGKWSYWGYVQYRRYNGWRDNSDQQQTSGFAKIGYAASDKLKLSLEYTALRNKIHMPGGLTDAQFDADPKQSTRSRNWLESPWNIVSANLDYNISQNTILNFKSSYLFSQRSLVWRNEDGWPGEADSITPSLTYVPRELEREYFKSITNELRLLHHYNIGNTQQTIAAGIRQSYSNLKRLEAAEGSTGTDFDLTPYSDYEVALVFKTLNTAVFAENIFHVGKKFSITPGLRYEFLRTSVNGYTENEEEDDPSVPTLKVNDAVHNRKFLLLGVGTQYKFSEKINAYANYSQSYRPVTYSDFTPFGSIAKVDNNLKDSKADNIDAGIRGTLGNILNFDAGVFWLNYKNRIGIVEMNDGTNTYPLRTNTGASVHKGFETYAELNISNLVSKNEHAGKLSIYNSLAYTDAKYTKGEFKNNRVEYAPEWIERVGINYRIKGFSFNAQYSYTSKSFGDASNATFSEDALTGIIPSYKVVDMSASYKFHIYQLKFGVNNLLNEKYFTLRTDEYPGPGIIPSIGRMIYGGLTVNL